MKKLAIIILFISLLSASCKKETDSTPPELQVTGTEVIEGNTEPSKAYISFNLKTAASKEVSFTVTTIDGTAKAGEDYTAVDAAKVTIAPGETSKKFEILIAGDEHMDLNRSFTVKVENVVNATLKFPHALVTIVDNDTYTPGSDAEGVITPDSYPRMNLVWSDEFNGTALNTDFWKYEKGAGGWGNNELQEYTDSPANVFLENGKLHIKAVKETSGKYTSARIITSGKKEFKYGRIDIRAKMPYGKGIWPALWMLGNNISTVSWPACGEIDIMEYLGHETNKVHGTVHYDQGGHKYQGNSYTLTSGGFHEKFHVFTLIWQENTMVWYVDYQKYYQFYRAGVPFNNPFFFIMNVAVGGNWPGNPDNTTVFPQTMMVDYIRVFQ